MFLSFLHLGLVSFGGPAMVAYIRRLAVERRRWLSEPDFRRGVALCQAVPGATAMQCAAYVGLRCRRLPGAVAAYVGFGLPAFGLMLSLSIAYRNAADLPEAASLLLGLRAVVVALVANAAWTFGRSSVAGLREAAVAVTTGALFLAGASPFLVVAGAGLLGPVVLLERPAPTRSSAADGSPWRALRAPARILAFAVALIAALLLLDPGLATLGLVMMKVDLFAFGGGYASLPLMWREVVDVRSWMRTDVFLDGIALGQVTPGPIVITATFVGYQVAGLAGAAAATVAIFLPSLFAVALAEPWFRRLESSTAFAAASRALVLSFVGLLASVAIRFALQVAWSVPSGVIGAVALAALLRRVGVHWVVLVGAAASALLV